MKSLMMVVLAGLLPASALFAQVAGMPAAPDFSTSPTLPGIWSYHALPGASEARFVDTSGGLGLAVRCVRAVRQVTISRTSAAPAASLFVWTSSAQRNVPARFEPNAMRVSALLAANDPLLDAIAFSQGRIAVSMPGSPPLVVTSSPEAARVFEDCRI